MTGMKKIRIIINMFLLFAPLAAWISMFRGISGVLSSRGIESLRYFTVLSNLFEGAASAIWLAAVMLHGKNRSLHRAETIKYTASLSVFLTFSTVILFLGHLYGYRAMFKGANLWLHLIVPLAAVSEMVLFVRERFSVKNNLMAVVPVLIYGSIYLGNIIVNGRGDSVSGWNDFYGFAAWGIPAGTVIFAVICLFVYAAGSVLRKITGITVQK